MVRLILQTNTFSRILRMKKFHKPVRSRSTTLRQPSDSVFRLVFKSTSVIDFDDLADILKFLYFIPTTTTSSVLFLSINSTNYLESCHFKYVHNSQRTRYTGNIFCPHLKKVILLGHVLGSEQQVSKSGIKGDPPIRIGPFLITDPPPYYQRLN